MEEVTVDKKFSCLVAAKIVPFEHSSKSGKRPLKTPQTANLARLKPGYKIVAPASDTASVYECNL